MNRAIGKAVDERISDGEAGRAKAALAAAVIGLGAAVTAYKFFRG